MRDKPSWKYGAGYAVFPYLAELFELKTFIETGTGFGDMLAFLQPAFDQCYSMEITSWNFSICRELFKYSKNVNLLFGDSTQLLPQLLKTLPSTKTFFWLDAHGDCKKGDPDPLAAEIRAIQELRPDALIAIDDVGQGTDHDVALTDVRNAGVSLDSWKLDYRFGRVMFMHRGQYDIPNLD